MRYKNPIDLWLDIYYFISNTNEWRVSCLLGHLNQKTPAYSLKTPIKFCWCLKHLRHFGSKYKKTPTCLTDRCFPVFALKFQHNQKKKRVFREFSSHYGISFLFRLVLPNHKLIITSIDNVVNSFFERTPKNSRKIRRRGFRETLFVFMA